MGGCELPHLQTQHSEDSSSCWDEFFATIEEAGPPPLDVADAAAVENTWNKTKLPPRIAAARCGTSVAIQPATDESLEGSGQRRNAGHGSRCPAEIRGLLRARRPSIWREFLAENGGQGEAE